MQFLPGITTPHFFVHGVWVTDCELPKSLLNSSKGYPPQIYWLQLYWQRSAVHHYFHAGYCVTTLMTMNTLGVKFHGGAKLTVHGQFNLEAFPVDENCSRSAYHPTWCWYKFGYCSMFHLSRYCLLASRQIRNSTFYQNQIPGRLTHFLPINLCRYNHETNWGSC